MFLSSVLFGIGAPTLHDRISFSKISFKHVEIASFKYIPLAHAILGLPNIGERTYEEEKDFVEDKADVYIWHRKPLEAAKPLLQRLPLYYNPLCTTFLY